MRPSPLDWVDRAPGSWNRGRLKDLVGSLTNGSWGDEPLGDGSDVYCVRAADFDRKHNRVSPERLPLRAQTAQTLRRHLLSHGDLILEKSGGGDKQPVGSVVLFDLNYPAVCTNFCARVSPANNVDPRFILYVFAAAYSQGLTESAIKQTTGIQNLDTQWFLSSRWAYPSLYEQRRIADFLDAETARIDRLVLVRQHQLTSINERIFAETSETLAPGCLDRPIGSLPWLWLAELPPDRPLVRLGYIARLQNGLTVDSMRELQNDVVTRPYLRVANVQAGHLNLDSVTDITVPTSVAKRTELQPGDVLMTEGGDLDKLGRGTVWRGQLQGCLHQNHVFAVRPDSTRLDAEYLALATRSLHGRCYFESTGVKTTNLASTNSNKILGFPVPLPSLQRQQDIVSELHNGMDVAGRTEAAINHQLDLLAERRQALVAAAVTGQLDVTTASGVQST